MTYFFSGEKTFRYSFWEIEKRIFNKKWWKGKSFLTKKKSFFQTIHSVVIPVPYSVLGFPSFNRTLCWRQNLTSTSRTATKFLFNRIKRVLKLLSCFVEKSGSNCCVSKLNYHTPKHPENVFKSLSKLSQEVNYDPFFLQSI